MTRGARTTVRRASSPGTPRALPWMYLPKDDGVSLMDELARPDEIVQRNLHIHGGILFRGFEVSDESSFRSFAESFGFPLLSYEFGSTPRTKVQAGVYTSTEYPPHQEIPLHNEQAYSRQWPLKIWFHCMKAPRSGGETPLADSRRVYQRLSPSLRRHFERRGLLYVRNTGNGIDLPWQKVFNTHERGEVERYCRAHSIEVEWKDDGELRTRQLCQSVAQHPVTGEWVWFNQAHLFHISALRPSTREALLELVDPEDLPRNVYYGDAQAIEESVLDEIKGVFSEVEVTFPWLEGDVLMLDNMLVAHGRRPFEGERRVVVAMAEPHGNLEGSVLSSASTGDGLGSNKE